MRRDRVIGYKLLVRIVGFSAMLAFFATAFQLFIEFRWDVKTVRTTLHQIEISRLQSVANSIWEFDSNQTRISLEGILRLPDISRVQVKTTLGEEYDLGSEPYGGSKIEMEYPMFSSKRPDLKLGTLRVAASLDGVYSRLLNKAFVIFITQTIKTFFVAMFILFVVREMVTKRLGAIANYARRLNVESLNIPLDLNPPIQEKPDELDSLALDFNDMRSKLMKAFSDQKLAEQKIMRSLREKDTMIRELYHRTKNNMQIIQSMLSLQARESLDNIELQNIVKNIDGRIMAMSLVQQLLYRSKDLSRVSMGEYINELSSLIMESYGIDTDKVSLDIKVKDIFFMLDMAVPFGIILNELMTNSVKYAFPFGRKGVITISLGRGNKGKFLLHYSDNGVGVPGGFDFRNQSSLGLKFIYIIGEQQMNGRIEMSNDNGVKFEFEFDDNLYEERI